MSVPEYLRLCLSHAKTYWFRYSAPVLVVALASLFVRFDVNYTDSLPDHVFLTIKGETANLSPGDYVTFGFPTEDPRSPFRKGDHFVKLVAGVPGDRLFMTEGREFYVVPRATYGDQTPDVPLDELRRVVESGEPSDFRYLGRSKEYSMRGDALDPGPQDVIPAGSIVVAAPHPDSLDSRYSMVGFVPVSVVMGKTYPLF